MKIRPLTTNTWLALVQVLAVVVHCSGHASALPTVNFTTNPASNGSESFVQSQPEIPYEELDEPRVLPLKASPVTVEASTEVSSTLGEVNSDSEENLIYRALPLADAVVPPHQDSNNIPKVVAEDAESKCEPATNTHGFPTFSADDNNGNLY